MTTQATEKLLKSYLLLTGFHQGQVDLLYKEVSNASCARGRTREQGHDVEACLTLAIRHGLVARSGLAAQVKRINSYYERSTERE